MDSFEGLAEATERLNAGAPIEPTDPALIERVWTVMSQLPADQRQHTSVCLGGVALSDRASMPSTPDQLLGLMTRSAILEALIERGIFDEYLGDELNRKKLFAAAAALPFDKNDLAEALAEKILRESSPDLLEKNKEELRVASYDPAHLKIVDKVTEWMRDHD
jgi:hypothetical protein